MLDFTQLAQGNMGAMSAVMALYGPETSVGDAFFVEKKLNEMPTIRGTNLYVLYSDLCDKDAKKVMQLFRNCPNDVLEDACSRQDRSGVAMVKQYFHD
jgi:hypothetical protein